MAGKRRNHSASFKAKVALEAAKETATVSELAGKHQVHPSMVTQWKRQLLDGVAEIFSTRTRGRPKRELEEKDDMLKEIGRLKMELEWLKKKQVLRAEGLRKLACVVPSAPCLGRQLELLGLARSSYYYEPRPAPQSDIELAERIDRLYTDMPFYGSRRMVAALGREGCDVGRKRVARLMEEMGLEAIYPKPKLSAPGAGGVGRYPYLLRDVVVTRPNHVWSADITYIPMSRGHMYLVAVIDWYSRYVLAWRLSNTLGLGFCVEAYVGATAWRAQHP